MGEGAAASDGTGAGGGSGAVAAPPAGGLKDRLFVFRGWGVIAFGIAILAWRWPLAPRLEYALGALLPVLVGVAFRVWARCYFTRGSDTRRIQAHRLIVFGPYCRVRNPLYVGNIGVAVGLTLAFTDPLAAGVMLVALLVFYSGVIRSEEAVLERTWGESYLAFKRQVPRWLPRLTAVAADADAPEAQLAHAMRKEWKRLVGTFGGWGLALYLAWRQVR
ncbi:MAG: isoprenylcysteine carboxylmethyltransferase family protein [Planctomycetes bacterium]|nr:isoprenylcysteine carboxylmethyltransferase family protein [Planctomycetota bacterium]